MTTKLPQGVPVLLPCPFCGGKPKQHLGKKFYCQLHGEESQPWNVKCCVVHIQDDDKLEAINKWNTRHHDIERDKAIARTAFEAGEAYFSYCESNGDYAPTIDDYLASEEFLSLIGER